MNIELGSREHIPGVVRLLAACRQAMRERGIVQWDENYPNEKVVSQDVESGSLFVLVDADRLLASITLNEFQDPAYLKVDWQGAEPALVVHRLCVDPMQQKAGIGGRMMDFAEARAVELAYPSVRLDTYSGNPNALKLYEGRGYRKAGNVFFRGLPLPFYCFEKTFSGAHDE